MQEGKRRETVRCDYQDDDCEKIEEAGKSTEILTMGGPNHPLAKSEWK